jgi:hypothetical protein
MIDSLPAAELVLELLSLITFIIEDLFNAYDRVGFAGFEDYCAKII